MTPRLHAITCPRCGRVFHSNLLRDTSVPTFYTGQPWCCFWCRTAPREQGVA